MIGSAEFQNLFFPVAFLAQQLVDFVIDISNLVLSNHAWKQHTGETKYAMS